MSAPKTSLDRARTSFDRRAWRIAFEAFACADAEAPLDRDDLERLAWTAALRGQDEAFLGALERLHGACIEAREPKRAARAAFWLGFHMISLGAPAAEGWLARASRLIGELEEPCAEAGYVLLPTVFRQLGASENDAARQTANEIARIGERCNDADLVAWARNLEGRALLRLGRVEAGFALIDEVMIIVTSGDVSPLVSGIVYCGALITCHEVYALDRARAWTAALERFCDEQPELVTFTGLCLIHRAEIMQVGGAWQAASEDIRQICGRQVTGDPEVYGDAWYQQAELHRLRGDVEEAEKAYGLASENGRDPQPGLALLRSTQGQTEAALSAIRRVVSTTTTKWRRARFLPAFVEIAIAAGELEEARAASRELEEIAREYGTEILGAISAHARGELALADGEPRVSIEPLRHAFGVWQRVGAPYLAARVRVLLARAFRELGDHDGANLESEAARRVFEELGAMRDLEALRQSRSPVSTTLEAGHRLSKRELEVLRLLATGKTNKDIGRKLFVSERTVDRHVSNIFLKLGVSTRAAATAFAYENRLV